MKRLNLIALTLSMPLAVMAQTTVFNDTFTSGSDTLNVAPVAPTSSYTGWENVSQKNSTSSSINTGDFRYTLAASTSSAINEAQALFTSTPVSLSSAGQSISLEVVFTDNGGTILNGSGSYVYDGLYNAGQVAPLSGLANAGIATYVAGGANGWHGFIGRSGSSATTSASADSIVARYAQTGTATGNQAVLANNASSGLGVNPIGVILGSGAASGTFASAGVYTMYLNIALTGTGETITSDIYSGSGIGGALVSGTTASVLSTDAANYVTTFDGLAFGFRHANASANITPIMDVNQVLVIADVPEPASAVMFGFGALALAMSYRHIRR